MSLADIVPLQNCRSPRRAAGSIAAEGGLVELCRHLAGSASWSHLRYAESRQWELLEWNADFDAWLLAWPPDTAVELHDHGNSSGAFLVLEGSLIEMTPAVRSDGIEISSRRLPAGQALAFGPHHVHDVVNEQQDSVSISLHLYSPPLTSMTYFDLELAGLVPRETVILPMASVESGGTALRSAENVEAR